MSWVRLEVLQNFLYTRRVSVDACIRLRHLFKRQPVHVAPLSVLYPMLQKHERNWPVLMMARSEPNSVGVSLRRRNANINNVVF